MLYFLKKLFSLAKAIFLRAYSNWMFDEMNRAGALNGRGRCCSGRHRAETLMALDEQDCLYTLVLRGIQNGIVTESAHIVTSISRVINPYSEWQQFVSLAESQDLRICVSNTTEAGIVYTPESFSKTVSPLSFPAKVAALLVIRFEYFKGAADKGLIFLPFELIEKNGAALKEQILRHVAAWNVPSTCIEWINAHNVFLDTLVDRIVPGFPKDEYDVLTQKIGYTDLHLDAAEVYHSLVIQGDTGVRDELGFEKAGLHVEWTDDMPVYRERKVKSFKRAAYDDGACRISCRC